MMNYEHPNRVYGQYRNKPSARSWFNITPTISNELHTAFEDIRRMYNIDMNSGEQLNIIGRLVGATRSYESEMVFNPNAFGKTTSQFGGETQFGSTSIPVNTEVSDQIYRILIRAKISRNNNDATIDNIIDALTFIIPIPNIKVIDNEDMTFRVSFGAQLDAVQRLVLDNFDVIPKPQGVRFAGYTEELMITSFGGLFDWGDERAQFGFTFGD